MSQCCNNLDSEICSFSASQSLAARCASRTGLHRSHLGRDLCGVPRNFREALSGNRRKQRNRRKQTETHGIARNLIWRFTRSGFVAVLSAKKSRFREDSPKNKKKKKKRLLCTALCLTLRVVGDEKQPSS